MTHQVALGGTSAHKLSDRVMRPDMSKRAAKRMLARLDKNKTKKTNKGGFA